MKNPVPRYAGLLLLAVIALLLSACTSAEELMEDGARLETEGRYEDALRKYIQAYDKDPEIIDLEVQITDLGNRVVTDLIAMAAEAEAEAEAEARPESAGNLAIEAAETYVRIDELVLRAFEVGIALDRPDDYRDQRYSAFRAAVSSLAETGRRLHRDGDLAGSDAVYRKALDRFDPTAEETRQLLLGRFEVLLAWADRATAAGHYREATGRADEAVAVAERLGIRPDDALAVRARAIDLGTLYVAAAPVRSRHRAEHEMSPWFLHEINDRLDLDFWSQPPEFIAMAHGALVRQRLRHLGLGRGPLSTHDARHLALDLDADLTVVNEIERFSWIEKDVQERIKQARTRSGEQVTYVEIRGKLEYYALVNILIVARNGNVIYDDHIEERRRRNFKYAEYDGDFHDLDVSGGDRKLFRRHRYGDLRTELEEEMAARITERVSDRVFDRLKREIR